MDKVFGGRGVGVEVGYGRCVLKIPPMLALPSWRSCVQMLIPELQKPSKGPGKALDVCLNFSALWGLEKVEI